MPRLISKIREIFANGLFKTFVSVSLLALDSNRVARTSRVFKIGIKNKYRTFKNYLAKNSPIVSVIKQTTEMSM